MKTISYYGDGSTRFFATPGASGASVGLDIFSTSGGSPNETIESTTSSGVTLAVAPARGATIKIQYNEAVPAGWVEDANGNPIALRGPRGETLGGAIDVRAFGAGPDRSAAENSAAVELALSVSRRIGFYGNGVYQCGEINLPDDDVYLVSDGATIQGVSGTYVFRQQKRGRLTAISGFVFTGNAVAFQYLSDDASLPHTSQRYEARIESCRFLQSGPVRALHLYGMREGVISNCYFEGNGGIFLEAGTINVAINACQFKNCTHGVHSVLTQSVGNSEGVIVSSAVMLGCGYGLLCERTTGVWMVNSCIDYCDNPIDLRGVTDLLFSNNYISTRTAAPAIKCDVYTDGFRGLRHVISNNILTDESPGGAVACVLYEKADFVNIVNNVIRKYVTTGLRYNLLTQSDISGNMVIPRAASGVLSIESVPGGDDATVRVFDNRLAQSLSRTHYGAVWRNAGFVTEATGQAQILNGETSVTVSHGLSATPLLQRISLTPITAGTNVTWYAANVTSTTFDILLTAPAVGNISWAWQARLAA